LFDNNQDGDGQNAEAEVKKTVVHKLMGDVTTYTMYEKDRISVVYNTVYVLHTSDFIQQQYHVSKDLKCISSFINSGSVIHTPLKSNWFTCFKKKVRNRPNFGLKRVMLLL